MSLPQDEPIEVIEEGKERKLSEAWEYLNEKSLSEKETKVAWYQADIGAHLNASTAKYLEKYIGLKGDDLTTHLQQIRSRAWKTEMYPCVGQWTFLLPIITSFPAWPSIVSRTRNGASVLDLGCCLGQDLRRLAAEGVPTENMYASDLHGEFWDLGYELFHDKERMKAHFIHANIFEANSGLSALNGKIDIFIAMQFLHLFSKQQQAEAIKRIVEFSRPGAVLVGFGMGKLEAVEQPRPWGVLYYQNAESFTEMWQDVARETGTMWTVEVSLGDQKELLGWEVNDYKWMAPDLRALKFTVTRSR